MGRDPLLIPAEQKRKRLCSKQALHEHGFLSMEAVFRPAEKTLFRPFEPQPNARGSFANLADLLSCAQCCDKLHIVHSITLVARQRQHVRGKRMLVKILGQR